MFEGREGTTNNDIQEQLKWQLGQKSVCACSQACALGCSPSQGTLHAQFACS